MYQVFICYPRSYLDQVQPFHDALELALRNVYSRDANVFQDKSDLMPASQWRNKIDTALKQASVMVVVVVPTILDSPQCRREVIEFIAQPGKSVIPLICEPVPGLGDLARSLDDHTPGSDEHERCLFAKTLREWEQVKFEDTIYLPTSDPAYKTAIMRLARSVRDAIQSHQNGKKPQVLDANDKGNAKPKAQPAVPAAPGADNPDQIADNRYPADTDNRKTGTGKKIAAGLAVVAALGVGAFVMRPAPEPQVSLRDVQSNLDQVFTLLSQGSQSDAYAYNAQERTLTIAAPITGQIAPFIDLAPMEKVLAKADAMLGFADPGTGRECAKLTQNPPGLKTQTLENGETLTLQVRVFAKSAAPATQTCSTARSPWNRLPQSSALGLKGTFFAEPSETAPPKATIRRGEIIRGPFWRSDRLTGWIRVGSGPEYSFVKEDWLRFN